jgi:hypothetical protein
MKVTNTKSSIMEIPDNWGKGHIEPFWDNHHHFLIYEKEDFNNPDDVDSWNKLGYNGNYVGGLCDMRKPQAWYTQDIVDKLLEHFPLKDIGTSYYRMSTGAILPHHRDTYKKYIELFGCDLSSIIRFVVFIEDWYPGHYLEVEHKPIVEWKCGDYVWWRGDVEHMAANIGKEFRFTLQITGHYGL